MMKKGKKKSATSNLPDENLAALFGVPASQIAGIRQRLKPAENTAARLRRYEGVDWSKSNAEIGREVGRSPNTVSRARTALGKQISRFPDKPPRKYDGVDWSQSTKIIAEKLGMKYGAVLAMRQRRNLTPNPPRFRATGFKQHAEEGHVNWDMRDADIAAVYQMSRVAVGLTRKSLQVGPATMPIKRNSPVRRLAMAAQKKIADAWYATKAKK